LQGMCGRWRDAMIDEKPILFNAEKVLLTKCCVSKLIAYTLG